MWFKQRNNVPLSNNAILTLQADIHEIFVSLKYFLWLFAHTLRYCVCIFIAMFSTVAEIVLPFSQCLITNM
jgi:hypothetical protein